MSPAPAAFCQTALANYTSHQQRTQPKALSCPRAVPLLRDLCGVILPAIRALNSITAKKQHEEITEGQTDFLVDIHIHSYFTSNAFLEQNNKLLCWLL